MIKAILMDFNGVIINDEPVQMRAYQAVLKGEGIDLTEDLGYHYPDFSDSPEPAIAYAPSCVLTFPSPTFLSPW